MLGDPARAATGSIVRELRLAGRHAEAAAEDRGPLLSADALRGDREHLGMRGLLRRPCRLRAGGTATDVLTRARSRVRGRRGLEMAELSGAARAGGRSDGRGGGRWRRARPRASRRSRRAWWARG